MTGSEAAQKLALKLSATLRDKRCTTREYLEALPLFGAVATQWLNNGTDVSEEQCENVWSVISVNWEG